MMILHTMLRVGNIARSLHFYTNVLGMNLLRTTERPEQKYSLAFVGLSLRASDPQPCLACWLLPPHRHCRAWSSALMRVELTSSPLRNLTCGTFFHARCHRCFMRGLVCIRGRFPCAVIRLAALDRTTGLPPRRFRNSVVFQNGRHDVFYFWLTGMSTVTNLGWGMV